MKERRVTTKQAMRSAHHSAIAPKVKGREKVYRYAVMGGEREEGN